MIATVKKRNEMPEYLKLAYVGTDSRGVYGLSIGMQRKMGQKIEVMPVSDKNAKLYDFIDNDGYMYRKDWLIMEEETDKVEAGNEKS